MEEKVTIKVDKELKEHADILFDSLGLDTETAVNIFLSASLRNMGIPFHVGHDIDDCDCDCCCDDCDCDECDCEECSCDCDCESEKN